MKVKQLVSRRAEEAWGRQKVLWVGWATAGGLLTQAEQQEQQPLNNPVEHAEFKFADDLKFAPLKKQFI